MRDCNPSSCSRTLACRPAGSRRLSGSWNAVRRAARDRPESPVPIAVRRWCLRLPPISAATHRKRAARPLREQAPWKRISKGSLLSQPSRRSTCGTSRGSLMRTTCPNIGPTSTWVSTIRDEEGEQRGLPALMLRPRRLGPDTTKLDTSVQLFGRRWNTPLFLCPVAALEAYQTQGESGAARAARARGVLQIQSHQSSQSYEDIAAARGDHRAV